jgi:hypothetical protein
MVDWAAGDGSAAVLGRSRSLPAVAEANAKDTGSAAESANRALHHLRNFGDGRPGLRMRLQRAHVFFCPWTVSADFVPLTVLFKVLGIISATPFERRADRYAMWRQKGRLFDVLNSN